MKLKNVLSEAGTIEKYADQFEKARRDMSNHDISKVTRILNKFDSGKLFIEFARTEEPGNESTKTIVRFEGDATWLMNYSKGEKPVKFDSVKEMFNYMEDSVKSVTDYVDLKKSYETIFHPKYYQYVKDQITDFSVEYPLKAKSLTYDKSHAQKGETDSNWDMEVIFRKNRVMKIAGKFDTRIFPSIAGDMNYGKVIQPDEIEVEDPDLFN